MPTGVPTREVKFQRERKNMSKKSELITRANALLSKKPYSQEDNALFNSYMRLADALPNDDSISAPENREASMRLRSLLLDTSRNAPQTRTYVPMNETDDAALLPTGFEAQVKNLMLADGPIFAGSPLLTNFYAKNMAPSRAVTCDDLSSTGFVLTENSGAGADEAEVTAS